MLLPPRRLGVSTEQFKVTMEDRAISFKTYLLQLIPVLREAYENGLPVTSFLVRMRSSILSDLTSRGTENWAGSHNFISIINALESDRILWATFKQSAGGKVVGETSLLLDLWVDLLARNYLGPVDEHGAKQRLEKFERPSIGTIAETLRTLCEYYLASKNPACSPDNLSRETMFTSREHVTAILDRLLEIIQKDKSRPWAHQLRNKIKNDVDDMWCEILNNQKPLKDLAPTPNNIILMKWNNYESYLSSENDRREKPRANSGIKPRVLTPPRARRGEHADEMAAPSGQSVSEQKIEQRIVQAERRQPDILLGTVLNPPQLRELRRQKGLLRLIKGGTRPQKEVDDLVLQLRASRQSLAPGPLPAPPTPRGVNAVLNMPYENEEGLDWNGQGSEEMYAHQGSIVAYVGPEQARPTMPARDRTYERPREPRGNFGNSTPPPPPPNNYQLQPFNRGGPPPAGTRPPYQGSTATQGNSFQGARPTNNGPTSHEGPGDRPLSESVHSVYGGQRSQLVPNTWTPEEQRAFKAQVIDFKVLDDLLGTDSGPECARLRPLAPYEKHQQPQQATGEQMPPPSVEPTTGKRIWPANACAYCTNSPQMPRGSQAPLTHQYVYGWYQRNHASSRCYACKLAILYSKDGRIRRAFCPPMIQKYRGPPGQTE